MEFAIYLFYAFIAFWTILVLARLFFSVGQFLYYQKAQTLILAKTAKKQVLTLTQ